ncbi:acetyl-CoA hydrolase/transferase family protein [Effusibacillus dendaii]|uniref:Acetyl-CoA hydrolase n=1 Tax=Effusibacillus dendaii TaxID=2743772 RepID=A0A7I8D9B0_9BACL|nr:acetyl-CoA hydrolase/transferase family protein [Effusibacillus dendaii]BCJ85952.1 acetyl-CoA hydrolase [Effusibacillus dendaii]
MDVTNRLFNRDLMNRIVSAEEAASWIKDGMTVAMSGFTQAGDAKVVPYALVERVKREKKPFKINVYTGASINSEIDGILAEASIVNLRLPYQSEKRMRDSINEGEIRYIDQHLSHTAEMIRQNALPQIDIAIVEAVAITEEGYIVPTTSVGNSHIFVEKAKAIIVELNEAQPTQLMGIHDLYNPEEQGRRRPILLTAVDQRIGASAFMIDPDKIKGIVLTNQRDVTSKIIQPDEDTAIMADHLVHFFCEEVKAGRLAKNLAPLQSGVGSVANAVFHGFLKSEFTDLEVYSEVLQDAVFDLIDAGKIRFASGCSITLSPAKADKVLGNFEKYRDKLLLRPQEISNHPEIVRRLGLIAMNTAIEVDIYGNVNSTHMFGSRIMNGIGGSGDFARNARLTIFVTKSTAKNGNVSCIVPFISHVDHTEHDVDVIVTEQGLADLRGLSPRERASVIINNCAHPQYRPQLLEYYQEAVKRGGQTPHVLEKALSWHVRYQREGTMLGKSL